MQVTQSYKTDTNIVDIERWRSIQRIKVLETKRVKGADDEHAEHLALLGLLLLQSLDQCNQVLLNRIKGIVGNVVPDEATCDTVAGFPYSLKDLVIKTKSRNSGGQLGGLRGGEFFGCSHAISSGKFGSVA